MDPLGSILKRSPPGSPKHSRSPSPPTTQHNTVTFAPNTADLSFELDASSNGRRTSPALSEGGSVVSDGADSEGSTSWQKKVRTMLLEGLSTENKHSALRRHSSNASVLSETAHIDRGLGPGNQHYHRFAYHEDDTTTEEEDSKEMHDSFASLPSTPQENTPIQRPGGFNHSIQFNPISESGRFDHSIRREGMGGSELLRSPGLTTKQHANIILNKLASAVALSSSTNITAEEVSILCDAMKSTTQSKRRLSRKETSQYIELLPEQHYGDNVKEYLLREFSEANTDRFSNRYKNDRKQRKDQDEANRSEYNKSKHNKTQQDLPLSLNRTFSLTKSMTKSLLEKKQLRSHRSVTDLLPRKQLAREYSRDGSESPTDSGRSRSVDRNSKLLVDDTTTDNSSALHTEIQVTEQLYQHLLEIDSWSFNIHEVHNLVPQGAMVPIGFALFERHRLIDTYKIDEQTLQRFLFKLQNAYPENPYHNSLHACDCAQSLSHFILKCGFSNFTNSLTRFAAIFAALVHDVGHPGVTNSFLVSTNHSLAIRYNDKSPLESMHASTAFRLVLKSQYNILKNLDKQDYQEFRHAAINMILATDNAQHNFLVTRVQKLGLPKDGSVPVDPPSFSEEDKLCILSAALHAADISSPAKPWNVYHIWNQRLRVEFHLQGDLEKQQGMSVLPFMDRNSSESIAGLQAGFIQAICMPLYKQLGNVMFVNLKKQSEIIKTNLEKWGEEGKKKERFGRMGSHVARRLGVEKARSLFRRKKDRSM